MGVIHEQTIAENKANDAQISERERDIVLDA